MISTLKNRPFTGSREIFLKANVSEEKGEFKYYYGKVVLFCVGISKEPCRRENFGRFSTKNFAAKQLNNCQT